MKPKVLVAGLVRNPSRSLVRELKRLEGILSTEFSVEFILVESDSANPHLEAILRKASQKLTTLHLIRLGNLEPLFAGRIERLSKCRDSYMEYLDSRLDFQYLCVFDTDGINKKISPKNVKNAVRLNDWVALFANQSGPYYDIYALRKAGWVSDDCFKEMKSLQDSGLNETLSFELAVRSKMLRIPETHSPIEVDSAFGGFAIYKAEAVRGARYWRPDVTFRECEHVIFNRQIHAPGRKLIVPSLINAKYTEHTYILRGGLSGWLLRQQGIRDALKIAIPKTLHRSISITISKLLS